MHPEKASYLQVERSVLGGGRDFLNRARDIGERVLGHEIRTSVTELAMVPGDEDRDGPRLMNIVVPVGEPNFQISPVDSLKVVLLHRRAEKHVASRYAFGTIFSRLNRPAKPVYPEGTADTPPYRKQTLYEQLDHVSIDMDHDPDRLPVWFDDIDVVARQNSRIIFGLIPREIGDGSSAFEVLRKQETVCEDWLRQQSSKLAELGGVTDNLAIRFASAPEGIAAAKVNLLIDRLRELPPVRLELGGPDARLKDSRRR